MKKLKQTIRYDICRKRDEDAEDWAWKDWLISLVRYAGGEPIQDSFKITPPCADRHCQVDFHAYCYFTSDNFPTDPRDSNMKDLKVIFSYD